MGADQILIAINYAICLGGSYLCACRLAQMRAAPVKIPIRLIYILWLAGFTASALSWTTHGAPTTAQVYLGAVALAGLVLGVGAWMHGVPAYAIAHHHRGND